MMKTHLVFAGIIFLFTTCTKENDEIQVINGYKLTKNETWKGEIDLRGDIEIPAGVTLTIAAGTKINVATGNLVWDEGFEDRFVDIFVYGKLIIDGSPQKIVEIKSSAAASTRNDWWGIGIHSNSELRMKYCRISDAKYGIFIFTGTHVGHLIEYILFNNIGSSVVDFGTHALKMDHCSFINVDYGYDLWRSNKTVSLDYLEFSDVLSYDLYLAGTLDNVTNNSVLNSSNTNFSNSGWKNISWSSDGKVTNSKVMINHSFGNLKFPEPAYGNEVKVQSALQSPVSGAGCGFVSELKSGKVNKENKKEMNDESVRHEKEIHAVIKKMILK